MEGVQPVTRLAHQARVVPLGTAAKYLGMKPPLFKATQPVRPIIFAGMELGYDLQDCDAFLDGLKAGAANDNDAIVARLG